MRGLHADTATAVQGETLAPIAMVELGFDSETVRVWSGIGELAWGGYVWQGVGVLGKISAVEETTEVRAVSVQLEMSGLPVSAVTEDGMSVLDIANQESWQGRSVAIYYAVLDGRSFVGTPVQVFGGFMDQMTLVDGSTSTIRISCESKQIDLERTMIRRYTAEDQRSEFPEDRGLDAVAALQELDLKWGQGG